MKKYRIKQTAEDKFISQQYRIKQTAEDKFISQVKNCFLGSWRSIDKYSSYLWHSEITGAEWCNCSTYEEAKKVIDDYKANQKNQKKYPKYHKL